ncbi:MAG TPA: beta-ketoacyl-[acyl-carrier-protein] synthase family protein [Polyangium sp.]|nr:beta-ketoacyl-[acyl-carrier-protein] synthase family protein [Polyangium sp.]
MRRRVVVTGLGVVSPVGKDVPTFWNSLLTGRSGVSFIREFPTDKLRSDIAANVVDFDVNQYLSPKEAEIHGRVTHFSVAAAVEAVAMAKLDAPGSVDPHRIGCLISTGMGSVDIFQGQLERSRERGPRAVSPYFVPGVMPNAAAAVVSIRYGFMGPSYNIASACATGTHSIATSAMMIEAGEAEIMVAGGAEAAIQLDTVAGFGNARALARAFEGDPTRASRPFDKRRQGFVMGEGAGVIVLEEEEHARCRGVKPLASLAGFGMTTDASHLTRPHPEADGLRRAIERALERANLQREDVDYINPHATSTPQGDAAEIIALRNVFGARLEHIPMSATKSMLGHLLGGAGAVETIAVVRSLQDQMLHPSINIDELDPEFGAIDVVRDKRAVNCAWALKCSAGFGGHNCALVLGRM